MHDLGKCRYCRSRPGTWRLCYLDKNGYADSRLSCGIHLHQNLLAIEKITPELVSVFRVKTASRRPEHFASFEGKI